MTVEEAELSSFSLERSLELMWRPLLGRSSGSLPATPTLLLASPLERSGRETPLSVDSLPLEWDHTGDVGGSSSHEDDEEEEDEEERTYLSVLPGRPRAANAPKWQLQLCAVINLQIPRSGSGAADVFVKPSEFRRFLIRQIAASVSLPGRSHRSALQTRAGWILLLAGNPAS